MDNNDTVIGAFSEAQVERLTGVTRAQLRRWHRSEFFIPSYAVEGGGGPFSRIFSFKDLVSLRVLNQLRNVYGISMPELRKTAAKLSHIGDDVWTATTLYVHRRKVVFDEPETLKRREVTSEQYVADIPLRVAISNTRHAVAEMNRRDEAVVGEVTRRKFVSHSAPVIAGTRIPVRVIKEFAAAGVSPEGILKEYPSLTLADVEAALAFDGDAAAA